MNWNDLSDSLKASLYDRSKSPFYGSFIISWIGWNWRLIFSIFGDGEQDFVERIIISKSYINWCNNLLFPLLTAFIVFVAGNFLTSLFLRIKYLFSNYRRKKIQKLELLDEKQTEDLWKKISEKELEISRMLTDKITEIESYKTIRQELTTKISTIEKENIELKEITLKNHSTIDELNSKINEKDKLLSFLQDPFNDIDNVDKEALEKKEDSTSIKGDESIELDGERINKNYRISRILTTMMDQFQLENIGQAKVIYYTFIENNENKILKSVLKRKTKLELNVIDNYILDLVDFVEEDWDSGKVYVQGKPEKFEIINNLINSVDNKLNIETNIDGSKDNSDTEGMKTIYKQQNSIISSDFIDYNEGTFNIWAKVSEEHNSYAANRSLYIVSHCGNGGISVSQDSGNFENLWIISRVIRARDANNSFWKFSCSINKDKTTNILSSRNLNNGWHMFSVVWSKKDNYIRFYIDALLQGEEKADNFPIRNERKLYIGNWPTLAKGHAFNSNIGNIYSNNVAESIKDLENKFLSTRDNIID